MFDGAAPLARPLRHAQLAAQLWMGEDGGDETAQKPQGKMDRGRERKRRSMLARARSIGRKISHADDPSINQTSHYPKCYDGAIVGTFDPDHFCPAKMKRWPKCRWYVA